MEKSKPSGVSKEGPVCYVIMPFKPVYERFYFDVIEPAVTVCGFVADKANETPTFDMLTNMIIPDMLNAEVIIAVLIIPGGDSELNPTVQYELGIAQSFRKPTVLITTTKSLDKNLYLKGQGALIYDEETPLKFQGLEDTKSVQGQIRGAIRAIQAAGKGYIPKIAITNALDALKAKSVFVDDLKRCEALGESEKRSHWLWGYADGYMRKAKAKKASEDGMRVWVMASHLHWYQDDKPYECLFIRGIRDADQKYYILYANKRDGEPNIKNKARDIDKMMEVVQELIGPDKMVKDYLKCIAIDYTTVSNFTIHDPDSSEETAIIWEPMGSGNADPFDEEFKKACISCKRQEKLGDTCKLSRKFSELTTIERWKESTFDVGISNPNDLRDIKNIFRDKWNTAIDEELQHEKMNGDEAARWRIK
jgi:hypothetical protein